MVKFNDNDQPIRLIKTISTLNEVTQEIYESLGGKGYKSNCVVAGCLIVVCLELEKLIKDEPEDDEGTMEIRKRISIMEVMISDIIQAEIEP